MSPTERPSVLDAIRARPALRTAVAAALPVGFVTALLFIPYVLLLVHSFWRLRGGAITHELTLENYQRLFSTDLYPSTILFSAGIAARVTLFSLLLAYPLAYLLAFKVTRHKQLMYMAVIIPLWVSYLVRAYAWKIILGQTGILNGLLEASGLIDQPLTFLLYSRWAVILALTHIYTPFTLMPIYAVLEAIPPALKEASQDLYASRWQTFRRIVLPLSLPGRARRVHLRLRAQHGRLPGAAAPRRKRQRADGLQSRVEPVRRGLQLAARRRRIGDRAAPDAVPALAGQSGRDGDDDDEMRLSSEECSRATGTT